MSKSRPVNKREIICVADMHVGSDFALWYPVRDRKCNPAQDVLYKYWLDFWHWAGTYDTVLLLGDLCDGNNRKETGRNLTTVELEEQIDAAAKLLLPHTRGKQVWGVSGTPYHQSLDLDLDRLVIDRIGGRHAGAILNLRLKGPGQLLQARHGSSGAVMYRAGNMDMESLLLDAAHGCGSLDFGVDILMRGHWHWYAVLQNRSRTIVQCPGWKLFFPYKSCERYGKYIPDIGGVKLIVSKDEVVVKRRLYPYIPVIDKVVI